MSEVRYRGDTITVRFACVDENGDAVPIPEGATLHSDMQQGEGEKVAASSCAVEDAAAGTWIAKWLPALTTGLSLGTCTADGVTKFDADNIDTVGRVTFKVADRVTRQPV